MVTLCLTFKFILLLPPALLLSDAVWFENIPNGPRAKPQALVSLALSVPLLACWWSLFNVKLIMFFWTVYDNKLDVK